MLFRRSSKGQKGINGPRESSNSRCGGGVAAWLQSAFAIRIYCRYVNASMRANLANLANVANVGGRDASFDDDVQAKRLWRRHPLRLSRRACRAILHAPASPCHRFVTATIVQTGWRRCSSTILDGNGELQSDSLGSKPPRTAQSEKSGRGVRSLVCLSAPFSGERVQVSGTTDTAAALCVRSEAGTKDELRCGVGPVQAHCCCQHRSAVLGDSAASRNERAPTFLASPWSLLQAHQASVSMLAIKTSATRPHPANEPI